MGQAKFKMGCILPTVPFTEENFEKVKQRLNAKMGIAQPQKKQAVVYSKIKAREIGEKLDAVLQQQGAMLNIAASHLMADAREALEKQSYWNEIKPIYREAEVAYLEYEKYIKTKCLHNNFDTFVNMGDKAYERTLLLRKDLEKELIKLYHELGARHPRTIALVTITMLMMIFAVDYYYGFVQTNKEKYNYRADKRLCILDTRVAWEQLMYMLPDANIIPRKDIFTMNEGVKNSSTKLIERLTDFKFLFPIIDECMVEAYENGDFDKRQWQLYSEGFKKQCEIHGAFVPRFHKSTQEAQNDEPTQSELKNLINKFNN